MHCSTALQHIILCIPIIYIHSAAYKRVWVYVQQAHLYRILYSHVRAYEYDPTSIIFERKPIGWFSMKIEFFKAHGRHRRRLTVPCNIITFRVYCIIYGRRHILPISHSLYMPHSHVCTYICRYDNIMPIVFYLRVYYTSIRVGVKQCGTLMSFVPTTRVRIQPYNTRSVPSTL